MDSKDKANANVGPRPNDPPSQIPDPRGVRRSPRRRRIEAAAGGTSSVASGRTTSVRLVTAKVRHAPRFVPSLGLRDVVPRTVTGTR
jgi:hypothetical protein